MSFNIAIPSEVSALATQSFRANAVCKKQRTINDIRPPQNSLTARLIFEKILRSGTEINVAFVDEADDAVISCYDDTIKTVFIRADKKYVLFEYNPPVEMPFIVLLYHELGHAKQYLDGDGARLTAEDASLTYTGGNKSGWADGKKAQIPNRGKVTQFHMHGYAANLETNNMRRHEWPICAELGIPIRSTYLDLREG